MLFLIAIIIFACIGFNNKNFFEGFQHSSNRKEKFEDNCISSCEKEAKQNGVDNYKDKCKKSCDKIANQCNYLPYNSLDWWECVNNINPNIVIPHHILNEKQNNNIKDNSIDNKNFDPIMEEYLDGVSNSHNDHHDKHHHDKHHHNKHHHDKHHHDKHHHHKKEEEINKLKKENEKLKKLQDIFNKDINKTEKLLNKVERFEGLGKPGNEIPNSDKDLYILKSEIVPPVCPACPTLNCGDCKTKAPPCPPCARCPEPSFECKKVPNYKAAQTNPYLPRPWLNDFSQFGNHP